jgi:PmbA protein
VPVIFDAETASSLLGHVTSAINGYSIYKGASFLCGRLGERIASPLVTIVDDGTLPRGLGSKPFDGEGLPTRRTTLVSEGTLQSYILDTYSARKLGLHTTHNASRSTGGPPTAAPTNLRIVNGATSLADMIRGIDQGFLVTELIGFGVNAVTGDYSQGAAGLWIEGGEIAYPIHEVTIAGHLGAMLEQVELVGNDLREDERIASPSLKIAKMTVAGE